MVRKPDKKEYSVGDVVLVRGRITRRTDDATQKTIYRINLLGIGMDCDTNEVSIAGITTDIPNSQDEE